MTGIDSISSVMSEYLRIENDTLKIISLYEKQLYPYLRKIEQSKTQKVGQQVYYWHQRNYVEFRNLLDRLKPPKETVTRIKEKPKPEISKKQLKEFKNQREFYYFEVTGDTTKVIMEKGNWTDSFSHKTFSKLTYNWINETEFELVFLNSNKSLFGVFFGGITWIVAYYNYIIDYIRNITNDLLNRIGFIKSRNNNVYYGHWVFGF